MKESSSAAPSLPQHLLWKIATSSGSQSVYPTLRCVCRSWKDAMDANLVALAPPKWPPAGSSTRLINQVSSLDLSRLRHPSSASTPPGSLEEDWDSGTGLAGPDQEGAAGTSHSSSVLGKNSSQLDLMGAAVLQPRMQDPTSSTAAASLMCYVASAWPEAVPYVTPAACLRLWRCLPQLQLLQHLRLSGSMLLITSVQTAVAGCSDAASGLKLLQQHAADGADTLASPTPTITHTYTLRLPPGLCSMTGLRSLSVEWCLPHDSDSAGGQAAMPVRRRSYEGGGNSGPQVQHVADPNIRLPPQFGQIINLRSLQLTGHVAGPSTLLPLLGLPHLQHLTLGPGRISVQALVPLAAAGVLAGLTQLTLKQQGSWGVDSFVAVLAGVTKLQVLEVQELEMASAELSAAGLLPRALTAADVRPLAKTLRRLSWSTCNQRLAAGASLLCPSPEAAGLPGQHAGDASAAAAGPWLGGLSALQCLELCGILKGGSVLGAPALDALSSSIGSCTKLGELSVKCLGVPLLPEALAQLPSLQRVSIEACAVSRRALLGPEAAVAVLARCRELRDITLAGCALRHVPDWLAGLQHVTALQLASNYLQDLPATRPCAGLPATLQRLTLTDNRLRDLPDGIAQLSSLSRLVLDSNYLSSLPACIWDLPSLKELSAKENMLSQLPECGCVSTHSISNSAGCESPATGCSSSSYSSSCHRPAGALPAMHASTATAPHPTQPGSTAGLLQAVRGPTGLSAEEEDLLQAIGIGVLHNSSSRGLAVAPVLSPGAGVAVVACKPKQQQRRSCACAGSLRSLVLANNQLSELPASMCQLSSLRELDLSRNQLRALPDKAVIWALTGLTSLQLADNHLHKLPSGLAKLQHLVELDVSGNHLSISLSGSAGLSASTAVAAAGSSRPGMRQEPVRAAAAAGAAAAAAAAATASESSRQQQQQQQRPAAAVRTCPALSPAAAVPACRTSSTPAVADARALVTVVVQDPAAVRGSSMDGSQTVRKKAQTLPVPLGRLPQLQQVCLGRQQAEGGSTWRGHCPLQLLLSGLWHLAQNILYLAPQHQCPVAKAAAAAADLIAGVGSRRATRATRERELLQRMQTEPGWVVVPAVPGKGAAPHM